MEKQSDFSDENVIHWCLYYIFSLICEYFFIICCHCHSVLFVIINSYVQSMKFNYRCCDYLNLFKLFLICIYV